MVYVIVAVAWLVVGAAVGVIEGRHGHWHKAWVVSAILGPFAVPLALQHRHDAPPQPTVLSRGRARRGPIDLLVGFDGSESSMSAASLALRLFGPRVRRVTLATVLDVDTAAPHADSVLYPEPWSEERAAREQLESAAAALEIEAGDKPGSVILAGDPSDALERYAIDDDYEVIVVGCRGKGLSKLLLGSCAPSLACRTNVPVLLIPAEPAISAPNASATSASTDTQ